MSVTVVDAVVRMRPDMGGTLSSLSLIERGVGLLLPLAAAAGAGALVKMGMDAQTQLSIVAGLTGSTAAQMSYYTTQLEGMGARFGMTLDESAKGLYYVVSAGYKGKDAIDVLTAAMLHAAATGVPLKDVANGLTSAMNAYGASAKDATRYSDILTTAITYGKQTTADFANNVSKAALMAAAAHVPFTQLAAAEAALTEKGEPANRAFTELSFMMSKIAVPSADAMAKSVSALGGHLDATKYQSADLMGKLLLLRNASGLTTDEFLKVVGGTRSARGALGLLADGGVAYNKILDQMRNNTGVTAAAFEIHTHTMQYAFDQVKASVSNAGYELVKMISPGVVDFIGKLSDKLDHLPDLFRAIGNAVGPAFASLGDTVTKVDGPMTTFHKHIGDASTVLNTHKGLLSQIGDVIKPLFDTYSKVAVGVDNFRGNLVGTTTQITRHKGLLSQLGDFIQAVVVPALQHLGDAFSHLPALIQKVGDLIGWIKEHFDIIGPILAGVAATIAVFLVAAFISWAVAAGAAAVATIAATWPLILIAVAIGGLVALLIYAYTHWGWFKIAVDAARDALGWLKDRIGDLLGLMGQYLLPILGNLKDNFQALVPGISGIRDQFFFWLGVIGQVKDAIGGLLGWIGNLINAIGKIHFPDFGGLHIPGFASGTDDAPGGLAMVHKDELVVLPQHSRVIPASQTAALMGGGSSGGSGGGGGYKTANITLSIDGRALISLLGQPLVDELRLRTGQRI